MSGSVVIGAGREVSLADRYELDEGRVFLTGVQALVRVLLDQHRADARAGLRTAALVSGYQGSPLAGFDREVARLGALAGAHDIVLRPGVNEELGATAVWGSQLASGLPRPRFDGVLGVWYGKAPGVDRAADAIRHGNHVGTDPRGGVLALCGDDPACKSSTLPSASESLLAALQVPVLVPGSVQEALDLGRHAIACSRACGLWAALKVVTNVADAAGTVEVGLDRVDPTIPVLEWEGRPYVHRPSAHLLAPESLEMERTLVGVRLELARLYGRVNGLNRVICDAPGARLGVVASGAVVHDVRRALSDLGVADDAPVRVLSVAMPFPFDERTAREFAAGLDEIVVVEEKGPFLERLVKEALYGSSAAPPVHGKRGPDGLALVPADGVLDADRIALALGRRLLERWDMPAVRARLDELESVGSRELPDIGARRTPFFCSGCPHNSSTVAADGEIVGAGIGCHTMVLLSPKGRGSVKGITQMGGEGSQWIGVAPFVELGHVTQNLGDGTLHHSGSLAIRAAVAAKLDVTYKIFVNGTVAMTGGQDIEGGLSVPALAQGLAAEGVQRIVITTEDPSRYDGVALPANTTVRDRSDMLDVQQGLAAVQGVTVLLHDQACAAELRRARKRGRAPDPPQRVVINERICEGCGDCGETSNCLSVEPVDTEFGRKTRINQTSCNKDYSCLDGDCPSFLTVIAPDGADVRAAVRTPRTALPEPAATTSADVRVRFIGIGGTGVVTVSQVLGMAALLDGRHAGGLDQTGLSQKAGPVVSDVRITEEPASDGVTVPSGAADVLLALDLLGATPPNLRVASPGRTVAVASTSMVPTGTMIVDVNASVPDLDAARAAIDAVTRAGENRYLDAQRLSEVALGDATPANVVVLGAAWQSGLLPVSLGAIQEAFRLNGVSVERNLAAFDWGRAAIAAPDEVAEILGERPTRAMLDRRSAPIVDRAAGDDSGELRRLVEIRVPELIAWGGSGPARRYADAVARVRAVESDRVPGSTRLAEALARGLYKLLAYKDEYEVARLHLDGLASLPPGAKVRFHLHPPVLRAMGMKRKLKLGGWFIPVFRVLRRGRVLRGTALDPFGYGEVRRVERALPGEYLALVDAALEGLGPDTLDTAVAIAQLPDLVRGYEAIKLAGVQRFRSRAAELLAELGSDAR